MFRSDLKVKSLCNKINAKYEIACRNVKTILAFNMTNKILEVYNNELYINYNHEDKIHLYCHYLDEPKISTVTKEESADETNIQPDKENKNVKQQNLKRNCNQRNLEERKKILIDNVACLNEHLQIARKDLLQISCKINELQELNKRKEIEQCRKSNFVCCCLLFHVLFLLFIFYTFWWLMAIFQLSVRNEEIE